MRFALALAAWAASWLASRPLAADDETDALSYQFEVDTVSRLFRRDEPTGSALVAGGYAVPLYHYAHLRVADVDTPWSKDSVDAELSAWGNLEIGDADESGRLDGDVHATFGLGARSGLLGEEPSRAGAVLEGRGGAGG